jgi:PPOX class probable F420-dependent enzyme
MCFGSDPDSESVAHDPDKAVAQSILMGASLEAHIARTALRPRRSTQPTPALDPAPAVRGAIDDSSRVRIPAVMSTEIPNSHIELLTQKKAFAHLATLMADGSPQVTPVWVDFDGSHVLVNSARGRLKDKNMELHREVALSVQDPENPYRYLGVRGKVVEITEQGADEHIDKLAKKYLGADKYPGHRPGEVRRIYKIEPLIVDAKR